MSRAARYLGFSINRDAPVFVASATIGLSMAAVAAPILPSSERLPVWLVQTVGILGGTVLTKSFDRTPLKAIWATAALLAWFILLELVSGNRCLPARCPIC